MKQFFEFLVYYTLLALMWVGAEYIFEGVVHSSAVDAVFCAVLARLIQRND